MSVSILVVDDEPDVVDLFRQHFRRECRVEDGRGGLGHAATLRFPSPLIKPDVRVARIRLSDWLRVKAHGGGPRCTRRRCKTPSVPNTSSRAKRRVPREGTLCRRTRKLRTRS